jgi:acetyl/propionyl-CoA carboxylase alpha subunit
MAALGDKIAARRLAARCGVPLLPGVELSMGTALDPGIGYPLLVKAAAGGGGRGMRRVDEPAGLAAAIDAARQEAEAAFGDGTLYLERYLPTARHVEVQLLGDAHGALVHLGERECSIQRRHQKLIEESPSPAVTLPLRCDLTEAALTLARAARYRSTGTVEFLLDDAGRFYFLEVNTRLQVEHPVTEWVTGLDLVALQLRVAAGEPLPLTQRDVTLRGHAIECRLVAEDPAAGFLPAAGQVLHLEWPSGPGVRVDAGITPGSVVGVDYDSLLAKLSTWGETREAARLRMIGALRDTVLLGLPTVRDLHLALLEDPAFVAGDTHVRFLDERYGAWRPPIPTHLPAMLAAAAVARAGATGPGAATGGAAAPGAALPSPWQTLGPFRLGEGR